MRRMHLKSWMAVVVLALALAGTLTTAGTASAATTEAIRVCPAIYPTPAYCQTPYPGEYRTAGLRHVGWTYLNLNYCPRGAMCALMYRSSMSAWRWTGREWKAASLPGGWVYVYPYTGNWRWAWTQKTGWVAVSGGRFELR